MRMQLEPDKRRNVLSCITKKKTIRECEILPTLEKLENSNKKNADIKMANYIEKSIKAKIPYDSILSRISERYNNKKLQNNNLKKALTILKDKGILSKLFQIEKLDNISKRNILFSFVYKYPLLTIKNEDLTKFPKSLKHIPALNSLTLSNCQLTEFPSIIFDMKNINKLNLSYNNITHIPEDIKKLPDLYMLNLDNNRLTDFPNILENLENLKMFYFNHNLFNQFPKNLEKFKSLNNPYKDTPNYDILCESNTSSQIYEMINSYTGGSFERINGVERGQAHQFNIPPKTEKEILKYNDLLSSELKKHSLKKDIILYKSITPNRLQMMLYFGENNFPSEIDNNDLKGKILGDKGFVSTSIDINGIFRDKKYILKIKAPKGTKGAYIAPISMHSEEKELLLDRDQKMIIKDVNSSEKSKVVITCEILQKSTG